MTWSSERKIKLGGKVINGLNGQYTILAWDGEGAVKSDMVTRKITIKTLN